MKRVYMHRRSFVYFFSICAPYSMRPNQSKVYDIVITYDLTLVLIMYGQKNTEKHTPAVVRNLSEINEKKTPLHHVV